MEGCPQGVRTRFVTACGLVNGLIEARQEKDQQRILKRYSRYGLLILDELGYILYSKQDRRLLGKTKSTEALEEADYQKALLYLPEGGERIMNTLADQWKDQRKNEGLIEGVALGNLEKSRDLLLRSVNARFGTINRDIVERIKKVQSVEILDGLFDSSFRVNSLEEFKEQVHQATDN